MSYSIPRSVKNLEDEIAELERLSDPAPEEEEVEDVTEEDVVEVGTEVETPEELPEATSPEEQTFKKRYSDLRRHNQKIADDLKEAQTALQELKKQKSSVGLPTAEEAIAWAEENPKAAAIIRAIATNETASTTEDLSALKEKLHRSEQEARILKAFPDFEDITGEDEFHTWAESQPQSVQNLIYSSNADDVIWSLKQYKKEKVEKPNPKREAAKAVSSKTTTAEPKTGGERRFTESQVSKMSMSDYEANEEAINKSMRDGTFVYDLSGAAR